LPHCTRVEDLTNTPEQIGSRLRDAANLDHRSQAIPHRTLHYENV
jgi:hypothetical protein